MSTISANPSSPSLLSLLQNRVRLGEVRMSHWRDGQSPTLTCPATPSPCDSAAELHAITPSSIEEEVSALQKALSALSDELAYFRAHQARIDNAARSPFQTRLPPELLSAIFLASDPSDQTFPTTVSQVSQFFREIAFQTSALWSTIVIRPSTTARRVITWLERSGTYPITFELRYAHHDDPYAVVTSLELLKPHLHRCARAIFSLAQWESARVVEEWFTQRAEDAEGKDCGYLRHVQLSATHGQFDSAPGFNLSAILSAPYKVKSLHLGRLQLALDAPLAACTSIEELCISNYSLDFAIPVPRLLVLLQKLPNLASLTIKGRETITDMGMDAPVEGVPLAEPEGEDEEEGERRVCLPSIARLHLRFASREATAVLLSSIDLPNIQSISLELPLQGPAESTFVALASQPYTPTLTHVRLSGGSCGHLFNGTRLFSKLRAVQSVDLVGDPAELLCVCLGNRPAMMMPQLRHISMDVRREGAGADVLATLKNSLESRMESKAAAKRVDSLRLSVSGVVDGKDLEWLQDNVKDVKFSLDV
ncbi:hypothetical protein BOTBODRAFT_179775 [Botryobasidium botryosum FD-172 SS1]|uniref:Uncharacterized protein n=1 Tax=Botryobasidium botryosum (strain FD-172 SS1) TaxID=930990 RepID=A0A067M1I1_BOTB1|nr:hypothetical protein BOTBODRAFT_179775 [Botryobasidium botryosum FD-172 SS1]